MLQVLDFVLCEARHGHPDIDGLDFVYPNAFTTDVLKSGMEVALRQFKAQADGFLRDVLSEHHFECQSLSINLYVTGLTPAFAVFQDVMSYYNNEILTRDRLSNYLPVNVTYFFYDRDTEKYVGFESHWNGE